MRRIIKSVETLKLAYLSRTPIAWIVVKEKEVAQQISSLFINQHFGGKCSIGNSTPLKDISCLNVELIKQKSVAPAVYYGWIDENYNKKHEEDGDSIESLLSTYLDFYLNIEFEERTSGAAVRSANQSHIWDRNFVIITSPTPPALGWMNQYVETIYLSPIEDNEIKDIIFKFAEVNEVTLSNDFIDQLVVNFRGISERQIESVLIKCLVDELFDESLDATKSQEKILNEIRNLKRQMLDGFKGLKWITIKEGGPQAAGLNAITDWLKERQPIFSDPEKSVMQGFDIPNGILITGIPGTGKSLMAKQTARILKLPLVAMDLGDIQEGIVGKSEEHMAAALRTVDAMAPCVLWIDEIEKAFSGAESGQSDGGVMRRMFGKFLTWMQEKESYCFVLATSNDITKLPPELFRSQRFDEKYYTFMPSAKECAQMFVANIHLQNERIVNAKGKKIPIFDGNVFEKESYWLYILNNICTCNIDMWGNVTKEYVSLDRDGRWMKGYLPQKKLFTGADIAALVNALKFKVLSQRRKENSSNYGFEGPIKKTEADTFLPVVLGNIIPYGQSNLKDVALCFKSLTKNRFKSASATTEENSIIRFSDYNELTGSMKYDSRRFSDDNSKYDRTLYMCIVGAINSLQIGDVDHHANKDVSMRVYDNNNSLFNYPYNENK